MSFKFQLGEIIVPSGGDPKKRAKVEAIHLEGFMRVLRLDNNKKYMVCDKDYERVEEEVVDADN
tara:strand:+ start:173 stop:364 length:192 start_codon:yes stop_codon:yes gene_type:complete